MTGGFMGQIGQVTVGRNTYAIYGFKGDVISSQKQKETRVQGSGGGGGPHYTSNVQISSYTVDHHEMFLTNKNGEERNFKFVNWDFPCREGQSMSVLWIIKQGKEEGPYVGVINNNLKERHFLKPKELAKSLRPSGYLIWGGALVLAFVLSIPTAGLGFPFGLAGPPIYFAWRSRKDAAALLNGPELKRAEETLAVG